MSITLPCLIVKSDATSGRPLTAHTTPTAPSMSAGCAPRARSEKVPATAAAPRTSPGEPIRTATESARSTTSGSSAKEGVDDLSLGGGIGKLFGVAPHQDEVYYVGFNIDGQDVGLDPKGRRRA